MKVKVFGSTLLVIILLSSSVSATTTAGLYGVNSISTFLNLFAVRFIDRCCVDARGANADSWIETGDLLGGDADDYANGKMPDQNKESINRLTPGCNDLEAQRKAIVFCR